MKSVVLFKKILLLIRHLFERLILGLSITRKKKERNIKFKRNVKVSQVVPSQQSDQVDHIRSSDSERNLTKTNIF